MHTVPLPIGGKIDETGTLIRDRAQCWLRRDSGGRWALDMRRVQAIAVAQRVRVTGVFVGNGQIDVDRIAAA